jgi:uncharacterized protein YdiU (UPF0061 family)
MGSALGAEMQFDNSYLRDLTGMFLRAVPDVAPAPNLVIGNYKLAADLGIDLSDAADWASGATLPLGADPAALAYSGHQFGRFSSSLGDGRAHLLGEFLGPDGRRWDLQLKGSGRTPFSRGGDGKAGLGPMLREYLISEAMAALGIATTRSLAVVTTGETIMRDTGLGETGPLPGAVLARIAASHIRVGTFQYFSSRGEAEKMQALLTYTINRHFPDAGDALGLFDAVALLQVRLIAQWMGVGFIHGVMNTDNMALSGETIDYGPCGFMEVYAPGTAFSSIDRQGRYAYGNQPQILAWNLARLAETLLPYFDADQDRAVDLANARLEGIAAIYRAEWLRVMRGKLGLQGEDPADSALADGFLLAIQGVDWTRAFHGLAGAVAEDRSYLPLFDDSFAIEAWLPRWRSRLRPDAPRVILAANPVVIPRNHLVEAALYAASAGDLVPFQALLMQVQNPFGSAQGRESYALPAPAGFGSFVSFCGT